MYEMQRVALYIRVSTEEQALHGYSLEAQKQALTEYAQKNDLHIVDYYIDEGKTARKRYTKRKNFMRMMEDVQAGKIDIIVFVKLDRWFRNVRDYYKIQDILEQHNVNWKTIFEHYDTSTANGRLHINIMLSVAQDEADRTSERIKFVFADKLQRGEVVSGHMAFGYRIEGKKLVVDPEQAEIVKDIFDYYLYRQSKYATVSYIEDKYGQMIRYNTISRMLKKRIYTGEYHGIPNFCDAIIDREVFEKVQEVLKSNVRVNKTRIVYVYSGLLRCPICGSSLASAKTKTSPGTYNIHYRCSNRYHDKICSFNHIIGEKKIDEYLLANIEKQIENQITQYEFLSKPKSRNINKDREREKLKSKLEKLKDLYLDDLIDKNIYKRDYEEIHERLAKLEKRSSIQQLNIPALKAFLSKDIKKIYDDMSRTEKQALWRSIIKEIHFETKTLKPQIFFK